MANPEIDNYVARPTKVEELVLGMLRNIGEDPDREGLRGTPKRVRAVWRYMFAGYTATPSQLFTTFTEPGCQEMVVLKDIEFFSTCEHHLLSFAGRAHIGYIPGKKVLGVSKLARLLECYARRLQIQERIGRQVVDALMKYLEPLGCGCVLEARHLCVSCRGVEKQGAVMVTSSLRGNFQEGDVRAEFLRMAGQ